MTKFGMTDRTGENLKIIMANKKAAMKMQNAFSPHSNYKVGAAIVDERGNIHAGCNVENNHYAALHAEVSAIGAMIASGGRVIEWMAVTSIPCGACLQFMREFMTEDSRICLVNESGEGQETWALSDLLPVPFLMG